MGELSALAAWDGAAEYFMARQESHRGGVFPGHSHDHFEALMILSGRRMQHYGNSEIEANPGSLIFTPPGLRHGATILGHTASLSMQFNLKFLHPELPADAQRMWSHPSTLGAAPELLPFLAQKQMRFQCDPCLTEKLQRIWTSLIERNGSHGLGSEQYARAQLSILLLEVVEAFESEIVEVVEMEQHEGASDKIDELRQFIEAHLAERVTIHEAARHLAISSSCLAARIKRVTGQTFGELLFRARLQHARELLIYTDRRVSQVAFECGFEDHAYFSRRFRQDLGVSPLEYRRRQLTEFGLPAISAQRH
jgi:AraC-like DNA-binding protein